jgi:hypothetical protein
MLPSALTACTLYRLPFRPHDASVFQTLACEILPFCELVPLCQSPLCSLFTRSLVDALLVPYRSLHVSLGYSYEYVHYIPFALGAPKAAPARPGLRPFALSMRETMCTEHESIWFLLLKLGASCRVDFVRFSAEREASSFVHCAGKGNTRLRIRWRLDELFYF